MKATLIRTTEHPSKYGGKFYYVFFKDTKGRSYRSCIVPTNRNFEQWKEFIGKEFVELDGLKKRRGKKDEIDADCEPREIQCNMSI